MTSPGLTRATASNRGRKDRAIVLDPVPFHVDNDNAEAKTLQIDFELEASIDRYESIEVPLCLSGHFRVGKCTPVEFGNGKDFMADKRLPDSRINTLV